MKVYLRGIPHFGYVVPREADNFKDFLESLELRVKPGVFGARSDYYEGKNRVLVYLGREDYFNEIQAKPQLFLKASPDDGRVLAAGTGGCAAHDSLLHVSPENDRRFQSLLAVVKEAELVKRAQEAAQEERQERLRERLIDLAEHIGIETAINYLLTKEPRD